MSERPILQKINRSSCDKLGQLVPPARIELAAHGLGIQCSIHWATGAFWNDIGTLCLTIHHFFIVNLVNCNRICGLLWIRVPNLLLRCKLKIGIWHDMVTAKNRFCFVPWYRHGYASRDSIPSHIPDCSLSWVVEKPYSNLSPISSNFSPPN